MPTQFKGTRTYQAEITSWVLENIYDVAEILHPATRVYDDGGREVEVITYKDILKERSLKIEHPTDEWKRKINKYNRVDTGEVRANDFIGFVPSAQRNNNKVVRNTILKSIKRYFLQTGYIFNVYGACDWGFIDFNDTFEQYTINGVLDVIIGSLQYISAEDYLEEDIREYDNEITSNYQELIDGSIEYDEYKYQDVYLRAGKWDTIFSSNRNAESVSAYIDKIFVGGYKVISRKNKYVRIKYGMTVIIPKTTEEIVKEYFDTNPTASNSSAARVLNLSRPTIIKYKV